MSHVIAPRFIGPALDDGGYQIGYSCRFNPADSAYLNWTPGVTGTSRTIYSGSVWMKRALLGAVQRIYSVGSGPGTQEVLYFTADDKLSWNLHITGADNQLRVSTDVYRDPTAWYNIVWARSGATARIWVNGEEITAWDLNSGPGASDNGYFTSTLAHAIARDGYGAGNYGGGYFSQFVQIDGTALVATDFGEFDSHGVWRPIDVTGLTFGTNGFLLDFADEDDLGHDAAPGGTNDFASSGLYPEDQMIDSPTTNFATLSPINHNPNGILSDGNLHARAASSNHQYAGATIAIPTTGKWAWEVQQTSGPAVEIGLGDRRAAVGDDVNDGTQLIFATNTGDFAKYYSGVSQTPPASIPDPTTSLMRLEYDADTDVLEIFDDNVSVRTVSPTGLRPHCEDGVLYMIVGPYGSTPSECDVNFGQKDMTPTDEFKALNAANLPTLSSTSPITGSFTGNGNADGPFVWLGYTPDTTTTSTINGNTITWGTHARPTAGGFKVISSSSGYNNNGVSNSYSIAVVHPFGGADVTPMTAR